MRKIKQTPPLKSVHEGVQMRFTIGHIPLKCRNSQATIRLAAAMAKRRNGILGAAVINQRPAASPSSIVPSVGMKLSVR